MQRFKEKALLSAIYLTATLLAACLISLGGRVVVASAPQTEPAERFPTLYATPPEAFHTPQQKTVYFTFDDGPSKTTEVLLNMLAAENVKATFFVTAQEEDREYAQMLLRRMRDEGHTIGLHSYSHNFTKIYSSLESYLEDLQKLDDYIFEATGVRSDILRFPGGSASANCDKALMRRIAGEVSRRGYVFYDWTVPSGDHTGSAKPVSELAGTILKKIGDGPVEIVLCHDSAAPKTTPDAVQSVIATLRKQGWTFDRLTNETPPVQLLAPRCNGACGIACACGTSCICKGRCKCDAPCACDKPCLCKTG